MCKQVGTGAGKGMKRQEAELEGGEVKKLRFFLGVMRMDRIRNEYIRHEAQKKTKEATFGCSERRHGVGWYERRGLRE